MTIQATENDVVFSGHGKVVVEGETIIPQGIKLVLLSPPGASISDDLGGKLENGKKIKGLKIISPKTGDKSSTQVITYSAGDSAPNLILQNPSNLKLRPGVPHMIGSFENIQLSDLWQRVEKFLVPNKVITCYWAACTVLQGATNPVVIAE
jgi:hypothetical protein